MTINQIDQALFYLKEGMIEQVTTSRLQGAKAVKLLSGWVSVTTTFLEGKQGSTPPATKIGTAPILALLEKTSKNLAVIEKKIPDHSIILHINSSKLSASKTLKEEDIKVAALFDGTRSIGQVVELSGKSELVLLTYTCRLLMAGVAKERVVLKTVMGEEEQILLLHSLDETLTELIGLVAPILVDDAFAEIQSQPDMLSKEEVPLLLAAIRKKLDDTEQEELDKWEREYMGIA